MITFKEYLEEAALNTSIYGAWVDSKKGEILDVYNHAGHGDVMWEYIDKHRINAPGAYTWAFKNGWIRTINNKNRFGNELNIEGLEKDIRKSWKYIKSSALKIDRVVIEFTGPKSGQFKMYNVKDRDNREALFTAMKKGF